MGYKKWLENKHLLGYWGGKVVTSKCQNVFSVEECIHHNFIVSQEGKLRMLNSELKENDLMNNILL